MAAIDVADCTVTQSSPNAGLTEVWFQTLATADANDTLALTLKDYGISDTGLLAVQSWVHTTSNSVITTEANTTAVSSGVLTVTIAAGTNNDVRVIRVVGRAIPNVTA